MIILDNYYYMHKSIQKCMYAYSYTHEISSQSLVMAITNLVNEMKIKQKSFRHKKSLRPCLHSEI